MATHEVLHVKSYVSNRLASLQLVPLGCQLQVCAAAAGGSFSCYLLSYSQVYRFQRAQQQQRAMLQAGRLTRSLTHIERCLEVRTPQWSEGGWGRRRPSTRAPTHHPPSRAPPADPDTATVNRLAVRDDCAQGLIAAQAVCTAYITTRHSKIVDSRHVHELDCLRQYVFM